MHTVTSGQAAALYQLATGTKLVSLVADFRFARDHVGGCLPASTFAEFLAVNRLAVAEVAA